MVCLFNNNLAFEVQRIRTSFTLSVYLLARFALFFEFDYNVKTIKWIPVYQRLNNSHRIMFLLFSFGITIPQT